MYKQDIVLKICIFGNGGVGKSALTRRYLTGNFEMDTKMTLGANILVKFLTIEDIKIACQIWDFGGEEMFRFLLPVYAHGSSGGIFMYDIIRKKSLRDVGEWLDRFKDGLAEEERDIPIIIIGGKTDLQERRVITSEDVIKIQKKYDLFAHFECSAKTNENLEILFDTLVREILRRKGLI